MPQPAGIHIYDLSDLCTPWCIHVVATLQVADHVAAGHTAIGDLATATECDSDALHAVLTYLVGKGVFTEPTAGQFGLTDLGRELLDPSLRLGLNLDQLLRTAQPGSAG